uniref:Minor capsid protein P11 C-terminal conserved region domain-containing protein n=1 Tax=viral metagenome TaxID=1070528 RepID=A0A6C0I0E2_9ZZZZ
MFKEFLRGFANFFTKDKVIILVVFLVLVLGLSMYSGSKRTRYDAMTGSGHVKPATPKDLLSNNDHVVNEQATAVESFDMPTMPTMHSSSSSTTNTSDLLPLDQNSQWASLNPVNGGNVAMPDLLQAGYHIGLDTIGQTLRNANYQYRSDPIIPKVDVGPWNQSTIEADYGRVPLEIG